MKSNFNRRDFLKLAGALPAGLFTSKIAKTLGISAAPVKKNILIIVFDAFFAANISLYGYGRSTTPMRETGDIGHSVVKSGYDKIFTT
jgi:hypothetical protein